MNLPEKTRIEPELPKGFRDFLPDEMSALEEMLDTVRTIYRSYGFRPQQTSTIEFEQVLTGEVGGETGSQIYRFKDSAETPLGLRFDLTVPLSRVVAKYHKTLRFPYKRYQYSRVWRYDKPAPGRYREFGQFDVDIVGTRSLEADAELCMLMYDVAQTLNIGRFLLRLNNRKILNALAQKIHLKDSEEVKQLFRELDKIDKQGFKKVREFLAEKPKSGQSYPEGTPLGLSLSALDEIEKFVSLSGNVPKEAAEEGERSFPEFLENSLVLKQLKAFFQEIPLGLEGTDELEKILIRLAGAGLDPSYFQIDVNIARGLDYYSGPIFEMVLPEYPAFGTLFSGGRYDSLIGRFVDYENFFKEFQEYRALWKKPETGEPLIPAVGASLGVDRLFFILKELKKIPSIPPPSSEILMTRMDPQFNTEYFKIVRYLRERGFRIELYCGESSKFKQQMKYADRLRIPIVLILGEEEHQQGLIKVRSMEGEREEGNTDAKEKDVALEALPETLKKMLQERQNS